MSSTARGRATAHQDLLSLGGWHPAPRELEALIYAAVLVELAAKNYDVYNAEITEQ